MPQYSENGWEVYSRSMRPPVDDDDESDRYTKAILPFDVAVGDSVKFGPGTQILPIAKGSPPSMELFATPPCNGYISGFLIGAVWNSTRREIERRRWILTTVYHREGVLEQEVAVVPFEGINIEWVQKAETHFDAGRSAAS
eukprot:3747478-Pleurochrysis_carterae.AAC.1